MIGALIALVVISSLLIAAACVAAFEQLSLSYLLWRDARRRRKLYGVGGGR